MNGAAAVSLMVAAWLFAAYLSWGMIEAAFNDRFVQACFLGSVSLLLVEIYSRARVKVAG